MSTNPSMNEQPDRHERWASALPAIRLGSLVLFLVILVGLAQFGLEQFSPWVMAAPLVALLLGDLESAWSKAQVNGGAQTMASATNLGSVLWQVIMALVFHGVLIGAVMRATGDAAADHAECSIKAQSSSAWGCGAGGQAAGSKPKGTGGCGSGGCGAASGGGCGSGGCGAEGGKSACGCGAGDKSSATATTQTPQVQNRNQQRMPNGTPTASASQMPPPPLNRTINSTPTSTVNQPRLPGGINLPIPSQAPFTPSPTRPTSGLQPNLPKPNLQTPVQKPMGTQGNLPAPAPTTVPPTTLPADPP